ncbi:MAG: hypothetical protein GY756_12915 [bacterium]|nr:hypothetical protein [bacterium]
MKRESPKGLPVLLKIIVTRLIMLASLFINYTTTPSDQTSPINTLKSLITTISI